LFSSQGFSTMQREWRLFDVCTEPPSPITCGFAILTKREFSGEEGGEEGGVV
jgi:hypothetical protein